jgi:hypothetical protein
MTLLTDPILLQATSTFHLPEQVVAITVLQQRGNDKGVKMSLSSQAHFFETSIQKIILQYECLNSSSDYVEQ